jgi:choline dehydrogenase-like flavoprotein
MASKDVILSAGTIDSPKILMLSGIGPSDELAKNDIPLIQDLPVGKNLRDHFCIVTAFIRADGVNDRAAFYGSEEAMAAAREQWQKDGSGPWSIFGCQGGIGYFKSDRVYASEEFKALPKEEQDYLQKETVPTYELFTHFPIHMLNPEMPNNLTYNGLTVFPMNEQSRGEVTLQSKNPRDKPIMDPKLFSHPFDQRVAIESLRHLMEFTEHPAYAKDTVQAIHVPKSTSDEDLLEFIQQNLISVWHMTGTVKMGKAGEKGTCVDSDFKILGVDNLRVADMSVVPVLTNNHTQATAYIAGASLADKLVAEYDL